MIMIETIFIYIWFTVLMIWLIAIIYFLLFLKIDLSVVIARRLHWLLRVLHIQGKFNKEEIEIMKNILDKYDKK